LVVSRSYGSGSAIELDEEDRRALLVKLQEMAGLNATSGFNWMTKALLGQKIDAIKALKQKYDLGLKEAKDAVESFCDDLSLAERTLLERFAPSRAAKVKKIEPPYTPKVGDRVKAVMSSGSCAIWAEALIERTEACEP
jgi:ribosomal protein L7/L12